MADNQTEHRVFLMVNEKYQEYKKKRQNCRTFSVWCIILSALLFVLMAVRHETRIVFLILWIGVILACVALMLYTDHMCNMYQEMLTPPDNENIPESNSEKPEHIPKINSSEEKQPDISPNTTKTPEAAAVKLTKNT